MEPLNITFATAKGRRPYQEDAFYTYTTPTGATLSAIMDGHGDCLVSEKCKSLLESGIWEKCTGKTVMTRLKNLVRKLDKATREMDSGSTLSVTYINPEQDKVYVAVLGDSPVLVSIPGKGVNSSPEHNVRSNQAEAEAAIARGGYIANSYLFDHPSTYHDYDYNPGLQMSRALGDNALDKVLSLIPDVYHLPFEKDGYVLMGSDGLFDPSHKEDNDAIGEINKLILEGKDAAYLVNRAVELPTFDNVTAILIKHA